jgi:hypothetical protein
MIALVALGGAAGLLLLAYYALDQFCRALPFLDRGDD